MAVVALRSGIPVAAGYLLPVGDFIIPDASSPDAALTGDLLSVSLPISSPPVSSPHDTSPQDAPPHKAAFPCAMIYAIATLPESCGLGFGASIVRELISLAKSAGYSAVVLCPASDSLFDYYSSRTELREFFYINEQKTNTAAATPDSPASTALRLAPATAEEYNACRERLLASTPHIRYDLRSIEYQKELCLRYGGGLYTAETPNGEACAIIEKQSDGHVIIKELLSQKNDRDNTLAALSNLFPADAQTIRSPAQHAMGEYVQRRFGMLAFLDDNANRAISPETLPWLGIAFD